MVGMLQVTVGVAVSFDCVMLLVDKQVNIGNKISSLYKTG
jgi:hypothetical protein